MPVPPRAQANQSSVGSTLIAALAAGLWLGLFFGCLRAGVAFSLDYFAHDKALAFAQLRVSALLPGALLRATLLALSGSLLLQLIASAPKPSPTGALARWIVALAAAALCVRFLGGWSSSDTTRTLGLGTTRGRVLSLALIPIAAAPWLALCWRVTRRGRIALQRSALSAAAAFALLLGTSPLFSAIFPGLGQRMRVSQVAAELLTDEVPWETLDAHPRGRPKVEVMTPSADYTIDGADMRALVMPPPARIRFRVPDGIGPVNLRCRVGMDRSVFKLLGAGADSENLSIEYRVLVGGQPAFSTRIDIASTGQGQGSAWRDVGGTEGLPLREGEEITLSTSLWRADQPLPNPPQALPAGFGGLQLESDRSVERGRASYEQPNIVLIVMDTLRADRLSCYGYDRPTSPQLDRLAQRGVLYERAYSTASWTWPSTASILSGLQPEQHGVLDEASCFLSEGLLVLPEALQLRGYSTAAFSANPLIVPSKNFDQGFEFFDYGRRGMRDSALIVPSVLDWLEAMAGQRFFLYLHLADPHSPLKPLDEARQRLAADVPRDFSPHAINEWRPRLIAGEGHDASGAAAPDQIAAREEREHLSQLYDACIASGDQWVGQVLDRIESLGLNEKTIIAFTSDHGEELFEHGLLAHGHSLHAELVHVPMILAGPGIPAGERRSGAVSNRALGPTLARLGGADLDLAEELILLDQALETQPPQAFFSTLKGWWNGVHRQPIYGLAQDQFVLHFAPQGGAWGQTPSADGAYRMYDFLNDPSEQTDLAQLEPSRAATMRDELLRLLELQRSQRQSKAIPAGESTMEFLRDIGYVDE